MRLQASEKRGCRRYRHSVIHHWLFAGLEGSAGVRSIHYQSLRTDINSAALDLCSICPNALAKKDDVTPSTMHARGHSRKGHNMRIFVARAVSHADIGSLAWPVPGSSGGDAQMVALTSALAAVREAWERPSRYPTDAARGRLLLTAAMHATHRVAPAICVLK
jgi:hypothetical protein